MQKAELGRSCKQCGACCQYEIPITLYDIQNLARSRSLPDKEVFALLIQKEISSNSGLYKIKKKEDNNCILLDHSAKCSVHKSKPMVCAMYSCAQGKRDKILSWTADCRDEKSKLTVWKQSVAVAVTKAYIKRFGATWNDKAYAQAITSINTQSGNDGKCNVKLSQDKDGNPLALIYDCENCERRGQHAHETIVTIDDVSRISKFLGVSAEFVFSTYLHDAPSLSTGGLKTIRAQTCIFRGASGKCTIEQVRPMHCRFTPCPSRVKSNDMMDRLYLGAGTVEQQFRHQLAMQYTRNYVEEYGAAYHAQGMVAAQKQLERDVRDQVLYRQFSLKIAPYRYLEDARGIVQNTQVSIGG